ncbi:hypothetical protein EDA74_04915 [Helicobacter pylori]|nr:hypothetical protein EDA74_04915 [Helicobacter pylori]
MRQNNETEKSFKELKENTQAMREQKERTLTLTCKTELKTPTREPKKSVLESYRGLKNIFNPLKNPPVIKKHFKMAAPFIQGDRIGGCAIARNDPRFQLD